MGTIKAIKDTILKRFNQGGEDLDPNDKVNIKEGTVLAVDKVVPDVNQHSKVTLTTPLALPDGKQMLEGYIYYPHWDIPFTGLPNEVRLPVKYYNQIDNSTNLFGTGYRQCNLTTCAMALNYLLQRYGQKNLDKLAEEGGFKEGESVYARVLKDFGDTIYHDAQTKALKKFKAESYFSLTLSLGDVIETLATFTPVPVGVSYKKSGHIILLVGYNLEKKVFYVHDPYGVRAGSSNVYHDIGTSKGAFDVYTFETFERIWGDRGNKESGWGRIFTSIAGQETGAKLGH
jgi:uncharacterized protein YvpB